MSITQLPQSSIKLLTCSQIITSVSSAVKELIENSLDAGAKNINVRLDNNGLDRIEVKDDGTGISTSNVVVAGLANYTSKISAFSDIESINLYGFRGEALNALCQVGNVTLTTATIEDTLGTIYVLNKDGQVASSKPTSKVKGTSIVVTDLFKNIPVRRQYHSDSKRAKEELCKVENIFKTLAVINPQVRFSLSHNKCMICQKPSVTKLLQGIYYMMGNKVAGELHELKTEEPEMNIETLMPRIGCDTSILLKGNADWSMVFINRRPVQLKSINKVVREYLIHQFGERVLYRKFMFFLLSFSLSPAELDVNLEPNKTRVLVKNEEGLLEKLRKFLCRYYGDPAAKADSENVESPAKKRRLDALEKPPLPPKAVEILSENHEEKYDSAKFEISVGTSRLGPSCQSNLDSDTVPAQRCRVNEKENIGLSIAQDSLSHCQTKNTLYQNVTAEKWSMGHLNDTSGSAFIQGPGVFVTGPATPAQETTNSLSTCSTNTLAMEKERQIVGPQAQEDRIPLISSVEMQEFESDWSLTNRTENSLALFAQSKDPPPAAGCAERLEMREFENDSSLSKRADNSPELFVPLKNPPAAGCSERLGPVISPPRQRNTKMSHRKHLQPVSRDDSDIDMSVSSQMGQRQYAGFTKFARTERPQIILANPGIAFTDVAMMLSDKWMKLLSDEREKYEEMARDQRAIRKVQPSKDDFQTKLSFTPKEQPSESKEKPVVILSKQIEPPHFRCLRRPHRVFNVSVDIIRKRLTRINQRSGLAGLLSKKLNIASSGFQNEFVPSHLHEQGKHALGRQASNLTPSSSLPVSPPLLSLLEPKYSSPMETDYVGFPPFACDVCPHIIVENPSVALTDIAMMLSDKWMKLSSDEREKYEEMAREQYTIRTTQRPKDCFQPELPVEPEVNLLGSMQNPVPCLSTAPVNP